MYGIRTWLRMKSPLCDAFSPRLKRPLASLIDIQHRSDGGVQYSLPSYSPSKPSSTPPHDILRYSDFLPVYTSSLFGPSRDFAERYSRHISSLRGTTPRRSGALRFERPGLPSIRRFLWTPECTKSSRSKGAHSHPIHALQSQDQRWERRRFDPARGLDGLTLH
ncbi:hypothetical protein B0H11DRAFT_1341818 [Mycena galericulata]|nr:hypothetical protein B0H11DRAFT_1341818 [Mycena galericulata]